VEDVIRTYDAANPSASVAGLEKVYEMIFRQRTGAKDLFWLDEKLTAVAALLQACSGIYAEATINEPTLASGGQASITYEILNRSALPITLSKVRLAKSHFPGDPATITLDDPLIDPKQTTELNPGKRVTGTLPISGFNNALISQPYWLRETHSIGMYVVENQNKRGIPENGEVAYIQFDFIIQSERAERISFSVPVQYKHTDPVLGELYQPLAVVPPVLVNIPAARAYVFADQQPKPVPVTLRAGQAGVKGNLALQVPNGWQAEPATVAFDLQNKDDEQTVNFMLRPLAGAAEGKTELRAVATVGTERYSRGIQQIIYPHIPTQTLFPEATAPLVRLHVARGHTRTIGYLMGAGDEVPEALRQLGYTVSLLDPATDLTAEHLARYDAVVLGVRAYNVLDQLKTKQPELLKYVENGGTMLVQYVVNRGTVLPQIGPYPLTLSADRVTVENTPVTFVNAPGGAIITRQATQPTAAPSLSQSLLNTPNKLTAADFSAGWVQEQGLYYPSAWDSHYQSVIASHDPGEADKSGAILVAPYGKGRYIYTGLSLFRELPAGVPGAYRILANLVESGGK
ncbi:MAG: LmbE family protein, partial [Hymenobacter sp.]